MRRRLKDRFGHQDLILPFGCKGIHRIPAMASGRIRTNVSQRGSLSSSRQRAYAPELLYIEWLGCATREQRLAHPSTGCFTTNFPCIPAARTDFPNLPFSDILFEPLPRSTQDAGGAREPRRAEVIERSTILASGSVSRRVPENPVAPKRLKRRTPRWLERHHVPENPVAPKRLKVVAVDLAAQPGLRSTLPRRALAIERGRTR